MSQLEVIGAGFGRTGTYSLKTALEILGYPCHHMETVAMKGQSKIWAEIVSGKNVEVSDYFFEGLQIFDEVQNTNWKFEIFRKKSEKAILSSSKS